MCIKTIKKSIMFLFLLKISSIIILLTEQKVSLAFKPNKSAAIFAYIRNQAC